MLIICDIDGTLNQINPARLKLIQKENPTESDFLAFLEPALVGRDLPLPGAKEGLLALANELRRVYFVTGRRESLRKVTRAWLKRHFGLAPDKNHLLMRPVDSMVTASDYKKWVLENRLLPLKMGFPYPVDLLFIDDDPHVLYLYDQYGIALKAPECWAVLVHKKPRRKEPLWAK